MTKRLYLLDAYALIYRGYFAFGKNPLMNSKGWDVTAVTGFTNTLTSLLAEKEYAPTHMAIAFDPHGLTNRAKEYSFYKANRDEMPEAIRWALPYIRRIAAGFRIPILEMEGFEADDVVGTIAKQAAKDGFEVYMVTFDKDYEQLIEQNVFMYKPPFRKQKRRIVGVPEVLEKWGIERTEQVIDILGMMGDSVDNIPGIRGVGEKTAMKLIKQFDSLENMLENTDQIKGKLKDKVEAGKENAIISKKLATIVCDVPVEYLPETYVLEDLDREKLAEVFTELEFRSIGKRILGTDYQVTGQGVKRVTAAQASGQLDLFSQAPVATNGSTTTAEALVGKNIHNTPHNYQVMDTLEQRIELLKQLLEQKIVCFDTETTNIDANQAELVGLAFCFKDFEGFYVPIPKDQMQATAIVHEFRPFFENEQIAKIGQNIKYDMIVLKWYGVEVKGKLEDTMLAHYVLEPDMRHNLTRLAESYLNYSPIEIESLIGKKGKNQKSMRTIAVEQAAEYAVEDADLTWQLHHHFKTKVEESSIKKLYQEVETPLVPVLAAIEKEGINVNVDFLKEYAKELKKEILTFKQSVFNVAGVEFNLDSPKQLGTVLFDRLGIPYKGKKTKTGQYSTNEATLTTLAETQPIVSTILDYRQLTKLLNTYVDALPQLVNPKTGRIHSSFNQAVAATGRLSSNNPNLQNIPIRTDRGRKVRQAFIPRDKNHVLLAADYSQVELRLMAAMSGDENMIQAFQEGLDIHTATAARVYGVAIEEVDRDMRRKAKMVNFGIIYGISAFGLAQRLSISRTEAKQIITEYFKQYSGIQTYMEQAVERAKENGYVDTLLGRRRYLKDIHSKNRTVRQFAERNAINTPIQGSAADIIKLAMIHLYREMERRQLQSKLILQVHDELVLDVHQSELEEVKALVADKMRNAVSLVVPLAVDLGVGANWLEAH